MLRGTFLWLSERETVFDFVKGNRLARGIASRFVAGETVEDAVRAGRALNAEGTTVSLDLLGESVRSADETRTARDQVIDAIEALVDGGIDGNVSIKPTQLGLDIAFDLCLENMRAVLRRAEEPGVFIRMDMEGSDYTEPTLRLFLDHLQPEFGDLTGVVIQSYLHRSAADIERLVGAGARVRLCKGAYAEPETIAYQTRQEVRRSFIGLMERLLKDGNYPAIATHDPALIEHAERFVERHGIAVDRFEFQMLYGVRRDLQQRLRARGYRVRVYVPFGDAWYPYLMRRLAERPANVGFMVGSVIKEMLASGD